MSCILSDAIFDEEMCAKKDILDATMVTEISESSKTLFAVKLNQRSQYLKGIMVAEMFTSASVKHLDNVNSVDERSRA